MNNNLRYKYAVERELSKKRFSDQFIEELIDKCYEAGIYAWDYELNPEHFAEELVKIYNLKTR